MPIYHIFIINRAGSLIYDYANLQTQQQQSEVELTFLQPPIDFRLEVIDNRPTVVFGQRDGVRVGYVITHCNNESVAAGVGGGGIRDPNMKTARQLLDDINDSTKYPLTLKFARPPLSTNEKIILSSMFHSFYAIAAQLSPVSTKSSGIEVLDADAFRLQCFQTVTGQKFVVVADTSTTNLDQFLKKLYELYADYALKSPFYSLEMPIRCELFDANLQAVLERFEKSGVLFV